MRGNMGNMVTKADLKAARDEHDSALKEADRKRAEIFAQASAEGMPQKEIIDASGYSRETVRRILNPDVVESTKRRRTTKKQEGEE